MTYQQFLTEIQLQIHSLFDTDVTIQLHKIQKNNGVTLDGLTILQKGCNISPTIYLNDYYKEYQAGKSIHNIILHIREIYRAYRPSSSVDVASSLNWFTIRKMRNSSKKFLIFVILILQLFSIVFYLAQVRETPPFWFVPPTFPTGTSIKTISTCSAEIIHWWSELPRLISAGLVKYRWTRQTTRALKFPARFRRFPHWIILTLSSTLTENSTSTRW